MCTAISYRDGDHYFGRNLDVDGSYGEKVVIMPRNFSLKFRFEPEREKHYAIIGMATVVDGYPLYFDATNEMGLSVAGLNFPGNANYGAYAEGKKNIAPFELTPYVLSQCATAEEAEELLSGINLVHLAFRDIQRHQGRFRLPVYQRARDVHPYRRRSKQHLQHNSGENRQNHHRDQQPVHHFEPGAFHIRPGFLSQANHFLPYPDP